MLNRVKNNIKRHLKKPIAILVLFIILTPAIIESIYSLPIKHYPNVDASSLLSFYGTSFGIIGSFWLYKSEKKLGEEKRKKELQPSFLAEVVSNEYGIFNIRIRSLAQSVFTHLYLYDEPWVEMASKDMNVCVSFCETKEDFQKLRHQGAQMNITVDEDIIQPDGYPKYIQLTCEDVDKDTWLCDFYKVNDCGKIIYYQRIPEIV